MLLARSLISVLLIGLMLPWGAYAGGALVTSTAQPLAVESQVEIAETLVDKNNQTVVFSKKRKCRTASLPGSPCAPDRALPSDLQDIFDQPSSTMFKTAPNWRIRGRSIVPPRAPPRFI